MLLPKQAKRLAIFAYFDADGQVDDYVPYLLEQVGKFCTRQIVMVNGTLTPEAKAKIAPYADEIVFRPNQGYDVTAYKEGVLRCKEQWPDYDEILFYNQTIFGPVCPLDTMFETMAARDVDFWGLTRHKGAPKASWDEHVRIPPHVQSFFFAVRKSMVLSEAFAAYWENLPPIQTYWDAVGKHEIVFTQHFSERGFAWDVYVHTEDLEVYNDYPLMGMPALLLRERHCPFFKRKSFVTPAQTYTTVPHGQAVQQLYDYLRTETSYPLSLVVQNILRTESIETVVQATRLVYTPTAFAPSKSPWAAVLYVACSPMAEMLCRAACRIAESAQCFVLFSDEALREAWEARFPANAQVYVCSEKGSQALFGKLWGAVSAYPYVLYLTNDLPLLLEQFHDVTALQRAIEGLASPQAVSILEQDPTLGLLRPITSSHQETITQNHLRLEHSAQEVKQLLGALKLAAQKRDGVPGAASRGGMFLARTQALAPLAGQHLDEKLFAGEVPIWECVPTLAMQKAGFLPATAGCFDSAGAEMTSLENLMANIETMWATPHRRRYDGVEFRMKGVLDFYYERRYQMTLEQAFQAKLTFKQKVWICLQIWLKPSTFEKLHRLLGGGGGTLQPPEDLLD